MSSHAVGRRVVSATTETGTTLTAPRGTCTEAELIVHPDAVAANVRQFRDVVKGKLFAVLKADAFGHGDIAEAVLRAGADGIGVATIGEALTLRRNGVTAPLLSWLNPVSSDFDEAVRWGIELAVPGVEHLSRLMTATERTGVPARLHLHVDVGMQRDGCSPADWRRLCTLALCAEQAGLLSVVGVMGHLSCAAHPDDPQNAREIAAFRRAADLAFEVGLRPADLHLAATAAVLALPDAAFSMCRIGAGLFGIDPIASGSLCDTITLRAPVVSVRRAAAGSTIGYDRTGSLPHGTTLALIPVGYGDGLPRCAGERASVSINGVRCRIVGGISMDQFVVDAGGADVRPGAEAVLIGDSRRGEPSVAEWAEWAGTIPHEILTHLGVRSARVTRRTESRRPGAEDPQEEEKGTDRA